VQTKGKEKEKQVKTRGSPLRHEKVVAAASTIYICIIHRERRHL
jgi:ribose 5-phosphate isomerase